ncbi:MAG: hypothetical protein KatS3mg100_353 [Candidatus Parcubacteria bacterium]|nr:MAG: hypothetical protein KatS3mg100_353 [Candidatus Parcubacteria bacterium]
MERISSGSPNREETHHKGNQRFEALVASLEQKEPALAAAVRQLAHGGLEIVRQRFGRESVQPLAYHNEAHTAAVLERVAAQFAVVTRALDLVLQRYGASPEMTQRILQEVFEPRLAGLAFVAAAWHDAQQQGEMKDIPPSAEKESILGVRSRFERFIGANERLSALEAVRALLKQDPEGEIFSINDRENLATQIDAIFEQTAEGSEPVLPSLADGKTRQRIEALVEELAPRDDDVGFVVRSIMATTPAWDREHNTVVQPHRDILRHPLEFLLPLADLGEAIQTQDAKPLLRTGFLLRFEEYPGLRDALQRALWESGSPQEQEAACAVVQNVVQGQHAFWEGQINLLDASNGVLSLLAEALARECAKKMPTLAPTLLRVAGGGDLNSVLPRDVFPYLRLFQFNAMTRALSNLVRWGGAKALSPSDLQGHLVRETKQLLEVLDLGFGVQQQRDRHS